MVLVYDEILASYVNGIRRVVGEPKECDDRCLCMQQQGWG